MLHEMALVTNGSFSLRNIADKAETAPQHLLLLNIILSIKWNSLIFIHDNTTEHDILKLLRNFSVENHEDYLMTYETFNVDVFKPGEDMLAMLSMTYEHSTDHAPHYFLYCTELCIRKVLLMANEFDANNRQSAGDTAMRHFSQWAIVAAMKMWPSIKNFASKLDNILVIPEKKPTPIDNNQIINLMETSTLLWKNHGRSFTVVGHMDAFCQWILHEEPFPNLKFGFNGENLSVGILPVNPWLFKRTSNGTVEYTGFCIDLINEVAAKLNFTCKFIEPTDGEWGRLLNGKWTGLIGQLARMEVDIVAADISIQAVREEVVDFVHPYMYDVNAIVIKLPDRSDNKNKTYMLPFSVIVWVSVLSILVLVILTFFFMEANAMDIYSDGNINRGPSFVEIAFFVLGSLVQHGAKYTPLATASRVLLSIWWVMAMVLITAYTANLVALLTVTIHSVPFNTLTEMVSQDVYTWGTLPGWHMFMAFEHSSRAEYRQLWEGMMKFSETDPDVYTSNRSRHLEKLHHGNYAYITDRINIDLLISESCDLWTIQETFLPMMYSFGLTNNSPYRKKFNYLMERLDQIGFFKMLAKKWIPDPKCRRNTVSSDAKTLTLVDVQSACYVIVIGLSLALLAALTERCIQYCNPCGISLRINQNKQRPGSVNGITDDVIHKESEFCNVVESAT